MSSNIMIEKTEYNSIRNETYECRQLLNSVVFSPYFSTELIQHYYDSVSSNKQLNMISFKFNDNYKYIDIVYTNKDIPYINEVLHTIFDNFCIRLVTDKTYFNRLMNIDIKRASLLKDAVYNNRNVLAYISFNIISLGSVDNNYITRITLV